MQPSAELFSFDISPNVANAIMGGAMTADGTHRFVRERFPDGSVRVSDTLHFETLADLRRGSSSLARLAVVGKTVVQASRSGHVDANGRLIALTGQATEDGKRLWSMQYDPARGELVVSRPGGKNKPDKVVREPVPAGAVPGPQFDLSLTVRPQPPAAGQKKRVQMVTVAGDYTGVPIYPPQTRELELRTIASKSLLWKSLPLRVEVHGRESRTAFLEKLINRYDLFDTTTVTFTPEGTLNMVHHECNAVAFDVKPPKPAGASQPRGTVRR